MSSWCHWVYAGSQLLVRPDRQYRADCKPSSKRRAPSWQDGTGPAAHIAIPKIKINLHTKRK